MPTESPSRTAVTPGTDSPQPDAAEVTAPAADSPHHTPKPGPGRTEPDGKPGID